MIDEIVSFYKFLGMDYDLTAALAIFHVVIIIFGLAFLAHFITKNYILAYARKTILTKDRTYSFEIKTEDELVYRGKIYCTDGFDGDNYNMSKDLYKENRSNDNKYTLI